MEGLGHSHTLHGPLWAKAHLPPPPHAASLQLFFGIQSFSHLHPVPVLRDLKKQTFQVTHLRWPRAANTRAKGTHRYVLSDPFGVFQNTGLLLTFEKFTYKFRYLASPENPDSLATSGPHSHVAATILS